MDLKWGVEDCWDTKFKFDVESLPSSPWQNKMSTGELLIGFFHFYCNFFNWQSHAVCIRLNRPRVAVDKFSLALPAVLDDWYIEDPFDLKHNLAGNCTVA